MPQSFTKGPGVYRNEIDQSEIITPLGTSVGAFVGRASQGITNCRTLVNRDLEFVQKFGQPDINYGYAAYGILEFLKESDRAYFVRVTSGTETYAHVAFTTSGSSTYGNIVANSTAALLASTGYEDGNTPTNIKAINDFSFGGQVFAVASIGPGTYGNNLAVSIVTSANAVSAGFDWQNRYDSNPTTDVNPLWVNVFRINVFVKDKSSISFNTVSATPVETFYVSRQQLVDSNGNNLYLENVINGKSKYIYVKDNTAVSQYTNPASSNGVVQLLSGTDNYTVAASNVTAGWTLFNDKEKVDANILVCTDPGDGSSNNYAVQQSVANIAASRQDSVALLQVDGTSATVTNVSTITAAAAYGFNNPSYVAMYAGWGKIKDRYSGRDLYMPLNSFAASIYARNDRVANVWNAPAGSNRAILPVLETNVVWNGTQIGTLRDANINTFKFQRGIGNFIITQKTAQRKNTALSNVHVRRLLNYVEGTIEQSLYQYLLEPNNDSTRLRAKTIIDNFLEEVASGGGLNTNDDAGFFVVCDLTNNTAQRRANGELVIDIYVKPVEVIEFIVLNTIVTKSGVSFQELLP